MRARREHGSNDTGQAAAGERETSSVLGVTGTHVSEVNLPPHGIRQYKPPSHPEIINRSNFQYEQLRGKVLTLPPEPWKCLR